MFHNFKKSLIFFMVFISEYKIKGNVLWYKSVQNFQKKENNA